MSASRDIQAALAAIRANRAQECLRISLDLAALVRLRLNTQGRDFQGQQFSPYSPQYAKQRAGRGRQIAFPDFNFSGALQNATRPEVESQTSDSVTIVTTARDALSQKKLLGALGTPKVSPRGNILLPSKGEIDLAAQANEKRIQKYFR
jgi:hypothetical protein